MPPSNSNSDTKSLKELSEQLKFLNKTVSILGDKLNKNSKEFKNLTKQMEDMTDASEDQEDSLKSIVKILDVLQDKIVNVNSHYERFADKMMKPLNLGAISGTLGITSAISAAHGEVQKLSSLMDEFRSMSNSAGNAGAAMTTMFQSMGESLAGSSTIKAAMSSLHATGLQVDQTFQKLTSHIGDLDQITGIAAGTWADFHGELVRGFGATIDDVKEMSSAFIGSGLQGEELTKVIGSVKQSITQLADYAKDGVKSIKALTQVMSTSIGVFAKMGISAQKAGEFIGTMMNPEDFGKNANLLANLGVSYEDFANSMETAEGKTKMLTKAMENLPQLAERISAIRDPFQRMNLAKSLGVPFEIVSKMAGKTKSEIQEMMAEGMKNTAEKEALEKKKSEAKANQEKFEDALWMLKMKMLGPVMNFVSNNYGNFFKVLDANAGSVARAFSALFGVIQKLIPLLVKVSIFIGENIAKAFEITVKPIGKFVDVILKLLFPLFENVVIPVVEKVAKVFDWMADNMTKIVPLLQPFAYALGGFLILQKLTGFSAKFVDSIKATGTVMKNSFEEINKGNIKGALNSTIGKKMTETQQVEINKSDSFAKSINTPIVNALNKVNNSIKQNSPKQSSFTEKGKRSDLGDLSTKRGMRTPQETSLSKALRQNSPVAKKEGWEELSKKLKTKSGLNPADNLKNLGLNNVISKQKSLNPLKAAGMDIGSKTAASATDLSKSFFGNLASKFKSKAITIGTVYGKTLSSTVKIAANPLGNIAKVGSKALKFARPIGIMAGAALGAAEGFINAGKYFGKELSSSQEERLADLKKKVEDGYKLNSEEQKEFEKLNKIKKMQLSETEKDELKALQDKQKIGKLSETETKRINELLKKQQAVTATMNERIAAMLTGIFTLGIPQLIDSFFGTNFTESIANGLMPIANIIMAFINSFTPIWNTIKNGFSNIWTDMQWAFARILAIIDINFITPVMDLWESIKSLGASIMSLFGDFSNGSETMNEIGSTVAYWLGKIGKFVRELIKLVLGPFKIVGDVIKGAIEAIKGVVDNFTKMIEYFKSGEILNAFKELGAGLVKILTWPITKFGYQVKNIFSRLTKFVGGLWDKILFKIISTEFGKMILGKLEGVDIAKIEERKKKAEKTDEWTNKFDEFADRFGQANSIADKQAIMNQLMASGAFQNLMSAQSNLDDEDKKTYANMLQMMQKQLIVAQEAKKEAKKTGGGIQGAIEKKETPPPPKPEIKLRSFSFNRLVPSL